MICTWLNGWVSNREASDLRRHRAHNVFTVMTTHHCNGSRHVRLWSASFQMPFYGSPGCSILLFDLVQFTSKIVTWPHIIVKNSCLQRAATVVYAIMQSIIIHFYMYGYHYCSMMNIDIKFPFGVILLTTVLCTQASNWQQINIDSDSSCAPNRQQSIVWAMGDIVY